MLGGGVNQSFLLLWKRKNMALMRGFVCLFVYFSSSRFTQLVIFSTLFVWAEPTPCRFMQMQEWNQTSSIWSRWLNSSPFSPPRLLGYLWVKIPGFMRRLLLSCSLCCTSLNKHMKTRTRFLGFSAVTPIHFKILSSDFESHHGFLSCSYLCFLESS